MIIKPENKALAALLLALIGHVTSVAVPGSRIFDLSKRQDDDIGPESTSKLRDFNPPKPVYINQDDVRWYERGDDHTKIENKVSTKKGVNDIPQPKDESEGDNRRFVVDHIIELQLLEFAFADKNRKLNDESKKISDDAWKKANEAVAGDNEDNCKTLAKEITVLDNLLGVSEQINLGKEAVYTKVIKGNTDTDLATKWNEYKKPIRDYLANHVDRVEDVITATGKAFDTFCDDGTNVSDYFSTFIKNSFQAGQIYLEDQIDAASAPEPQPTQAPVPAPLPDNWSYKFHTYTGNLAKGKFSYFILPGRENGDYGSPEKRSLDGMAGNPHVKRVPETPCLALGTCPGSDPPNDPPVTNGKVWVWTQSDSGATAHGPLDLDCNKGQDEQQGFDPKDTGLPAYLLIQSGHACAFNSDDYNWDGIHVKYNAEYQDVAYGIYNDHNCVTHDNGVSCNNFNA